MCVCRRVCRSRSRLKIVFTCCLLLFIVYLVLCLNAGLPTILDLETENIPYRFPVSQSWVWKDDIEYNFESEHESSNHGNSDNNNNNNNNNNSSSSSSLVELRTEETSESLVQDHMGDYAGQGRYIELEGLDDYILWRDRFADPPTHSVIRKIKHCSRPIHNAVFLKTHYTGSDVITNIFNRFADLRNLRVGLPSDGLSTFHWPTRFQWKFLDMMIMGGALPNILCNHARFNADVMDAIMDRRTAFVTVLREPSALFESTFRNLEFAHVLDMESEPDPYSTFLDNPGKYVKRAIELKRFRDSLNLIKNSMSFDLGLHPAGYHKPEVVRDAILDLDDKFTLVMIFEYLDESLVLLKRKLCWELDDILHLKFHYLDKEKNARRNTPKKQNEQVRKWNQADVLLYEYFNKTLWEYIEREGESFQEDLRDFRGNQKAIEKDCLGNSTSASAKSVVVLNPQVSPFNRYLCEKLVLDELQYLNYFRKKMENGRRGSITFEDNTFKMNVENTSATDDLIK